MYKRLSTDKYNYTPSKGVIKDQESKTIEGDSMSIKEMLEKAVTGVVDLSQYNEGQYDSDDIHHETDISHRNKATEIDLLEHISDNVKTKDQIKQEIEDINAYNNLINPKEDTPKEEIINTEKPDLDGD